MKEALRSIKAHWQLHLLFLIPLSLVLIFSYGPMYGVIIAFKDYVASKVAEMGENIVVRRFVRYQVGEAIEGEKSEG